MHFEQHTELDNLIAMQNLRTSANKESNDAYDVSFSLTIPGGQDSSRRQTVLFLPIDPRDKDHEDPEHIDFSVPRRARYVHSAWKKHQDAVFWVDIDFAIKKGINILSNTIECNYPPRNTSSLLYSKGCEIEDWRSLV